MTASTESAAELWGALYSNGELMKDAAARENLKTLFANNPPPAAAAEVVAYLKKIQEYAEQAKETSQTFEGEEKRKKKPPTIDAETMFAATMGYIESEIAFYMTHEPVVDREIVTYNLADSDDVVLAVLDKIVNNLKGNQLAIRIGKSGSFAVILTVQFHRLHSDWRNLPSPDAAHASRSTWCSA